MKLIGFTSWHNENYKFIGDLEDEQFGENDIQWMNYEETMAEFIGIRGCVNFEDRKSVV